MEYKDSLGERMKRYERCCDVRLPRRMPMIVRLDGRHFHSWTRKNCNGRPFDGRFIEAMDVATTSLCRNMAGCFAGYVQSDEISLLIRDDMELDTEPMFDKRLQKIVSVAASMCSNAFNSAFSHVSCMAEFDARAFVVPQSDVGNYFLWRQRDCIRNSISSLAQSVFSPRELHGKDSEEMKEMLLSRRPWDELPERIRMGGLAMKEKTILQGSEGPVERMKFKMLSPVPDLAVDRLFDEDSEVWK